ncbi:MAG: hypothetical protein PHR82_07805 [Endomicrobiaceae bacterium]|nr:hypothetical protein [Endomicrobiaceae bacterium]
MISDNISSRKELIELLRGKSLDTEDDVEYVADMLLNTFYKSIMCENNMLRKMRPVVLNGESARSFALALEVSELKSKLPKWVQIKQVSDLPRKCGRYNVCLVTSHYPTSTYDFCDSPYDEEIVTSAYYDNEQKLWILGEECTVNAMLIVLDDTPMNGQYISHWCEFPLSPNKMENSE